MNKEQKKFQKINKARKRRKTYLKFTKNEHGKKLSLIETLIKKGRIRITKKENKNEEVKPLRETPTDGTEGNKHDTVA